MANSSTSFLSYSSVLLAILMFSPAIAAQGLFREYIGAMDKGVKFSDVPINPNVNFHFILAFAIDYTTNVNSPAATNGQFNIFWDTNNLTPSSVAAIKQAHRNVKVAVSLGGYSVGGGSTKATFTANSVDSWVGNAVSSLTRIIKQYGLDGIDIDYESFNSDANTFAECIGQLITRLKNNGVISFASIAPYEDQPLQTYYQTLWSKYSSVIDYVNFQFYGYPTSTTVSQFLNYFEQQRSNYKGGRLLASMITSEQDSEGLTPANGFFDACNTLKGKGELGGIFIWSADASKANGFPYEKQAQNLLAS